MGAVMRLERLPDWRNRLADWLRGIDGRPIRPGEHDCCLFGAGAIAAQTGVDIAAPWRGRYTTLAGGRRILRRAGYRDHVDLVAALLPEAAAVAAAEGDIGVFPGEDGAAIGVVQGAAAYVLTPAGRLGLVSMDRVQRLFKVS